MRFLKFMAMAALAALMFTGCADKEVDPRDMERETYVNPELEGAPQWVMNPKVEGKLSELGSAKPNPGNDFSYQRTEAMANGRDNLARKIETSVGNFFESMKAVTSAGKEGTYEKATREASEQVANQTLRGSGIEDTWMSKTGTLYVLMTIDTEQVVAAMEAQIKSTFKNEEAMYLEFKAEEANKELHKKLEAYKNRMN